MLALYCFYLIDIDIEFISVIKLTRFLVRDVTLHLVHIEFIAVAMVTMTELTPVMIFVHIASYCAIYGYKFMILQLSSLESLYELFCYFVTIIFILIHFHCFTFLCLCLMVPQVYFTYSYVPAVSPERILCSDDLTQLSSPRSFNSQRISSTCLR